MTDIDVAPEKQATSAATAPPLSADEHWPHYDEDEIASVVDVLRSGRVNQWTSDRVAQFEAAFTEKFDLGSGMALANGTLAIELAFRALGIGPGDEVVVTPRSFVASASMVSLVGATPVFADVEPAGGNLSAASIEAVLTDRTKAIVPVHLAGWPADMPSIMDLAKRKGLLVIEDCAQAHGAEIAGRPVGSFGDAAAYSFCQDKIISTGGEGGFASFRSREAWEWAWSYKDHGKNYRKTNAVAAEPGFRWLHDGIGTNWRLTALQAAIGLAQLAKLEEWRAARTRNATTWAEALAEIGGLRVPLPDPSVRHAFYKFYAYVEAGEDTERLRNDILRRAGESGLRLFSGSCSEIYLEKAFDDLPRPNLPVARKLGLSSLMMEVHPTLRADLLLRRAELLANIVQDVLS